METANLAADLKMRVVFPIKHYKDEGFVERTIEINDDDLSAIIEEYLHAHSEFEFDEIEIVNNRPMNIWLHAKCRTYIDPDEPEDDQVSKVEAVVTVSGRYDDNDENVRLWPRKDQNDATE